MDVKKVLAKLDFAPSEQQEKELKNVASEFLDRLKKSFVQEKISADIFVGGSFAKGTLVRKETYDVDVFVRFDWRTDDLTPLLARAVKRATEKQGFKIARIHGSRDYFRISKGNLIFEIVPVTKIAKPQEARNVTDLSYFHVAYVRKQLVKNKRLRREIQLAKTFCRAQGAYGAESYIQGFSGYALECLLIYYTTFEKFLRACAGASDRLVLDPAKLYKNKNDILFSINESKLTGPIVLVDPTWKERNVLAALSRETFKKFQAAAGAFLKKPSAEAFSIKEFKLENLQKLAKNKKAELLAITLSTDRQAGDIAGTKLKKFYHYLMQEISKQYLIHEHVFMYDEKQGASVYFVLNARKGLTLRGPPLKMKKDCIAFRKQHSKVYEKAGKLYAPLVVNDSAQVTLAKFTKKGNETLEQMGITEFKVRKV